MTIRSIHKFAGTTLSEGDASIRRVPWHPYQGPQNTQPLGAGEVVTQETGLAAITVLPEEYAPVGAPPLSVTSCGQPFTPKRSDAKTCGAVCRKRMSRRLAA